MLPGLFSSVQPALKPRWRNTESDEETLNLDGETLTVDGVRVLLQFKNCFELLFTGTLKYLSKNVCLRQREMDDR